MIFYNFFHFTHLTLPKLFKFFLKNSVQFLFPQEIWTSETYCTWLCSNVGLLIQFHWLSWRYCLRSCLKTLRLYLTQIVFRAFLVSDRQEGNSKACSIHFWTSTSWTALKVFSSCSWKCLAKLHSKNHSLNLECSCFC